jgi:spoIIIJ-associated protein
MSEYQEFTGKTVEEALRNARESFGATGLDDLDFEILTPGSRGVLGMGAEPARILAAPRALLGGAAPRREAAAATPLPPPPPMREDRGDRGDGSDRGDRGGRERDRGRRPDRGRPDVVAPGSRERAPAAPASSDGVPDPRPFPEQREETAPRRDMTAGRPQRDGRSAGAPRPGGPRDRGPAPRRDAPQERRGSSLSQSDRDELASARSSFSREREEIQAAEASPEALAAGKEILETLLGHMGYAAAVSIVAGDTSKLDVSGEGDEKEALGALIGRKGERLSALQHLLNLMLSRRMGSWTRVLVDVEDYRGRRERQLQEIAQRAAEKVVESGAMLQLEPMPALERRWIHLALKSDSRVSTQSIGEEPQRRVVILRRD